MEHHAGTYQVILLVEDQVLISVVMEEALRDAGYKVAAVYDGSSALETLERAYGDVEAVVTDIRLGGTVTGWDVGLRARELDPRLPVVYTSGDSAPEWQERGVQDSVMLPKPYSMKRVVAVLQQAIG